MKKLILLSLSLLLTCSVYAQQEPLFAQYNTNLYLINPAVAGSKGNHSLLAFHRWQWVSFPGAPQTYGLTYQGNVKDLHGIGALLFADITGPITRWGGKLSYAFHIPLANRKMRLSIGLGARLAQNIVRANAITFLDPNDQAVTKITDGANVFGVDAEFGVYFYGENFYFGASAPNLIQTRLDFGTNPDARDPIGHGYRHYFITGGYRFNFKGKTSDEGVERKGWGLEPSVMIKYVAGADVQVDGGVTVHILDDQLSFGAFYRSPSFLSFQAKFVFDRKVPLLLSFDISLSKFQNYSVGATELMIGYDFPSQQNMFSAPPPKDPDEEPGDL